MYIAPRAMGQETLAADVLRVDKKAANRYEDCGLGKKAFYAGAFGLNCMRYLPLSEIERVYKRLAVSKGFFEQGKVYATISYLVVRYGGKEKVIRFTHEENLDGLLQQFQNETEIPVGKA